MATKTKHFCRDCGIELRRGDRCAGCEKQNEEDRQRAAEEMELYFGDMEYMSYLDPEVSEEMLMDSLMEDSDENFLYDEEWRDHWGDA